MDTLKEQIVVLGIGNVLWADEGFGVRCVEALQRHIVCNDQVVFVDGGTQGMYLIHHVQAADRLIIFDAIDYGLTPGELKIIEGDDVPKFMGAKKMSLHQTGFQEVLGLAQLTGKYPKEIVLYGCQPEMLEDYGGSLRDSVKAVIPRVLDLAVERLRKWGANPQPRTTPLDKYEAVTMLELSLEDYEDFRPSADLACRTGDDRFLSLRD